MRDKLIAAIGLLAGAMLVRNLCVMLFNIPQDALQGAIYRILYFHVPSWHRLGLGEASMGQLVGLGRAPHERLYRLSPIRRLPDAAERFAGTAGEGADLRATLDLCLPVHDRYL